VLLLNKGGVVVAYSVEKEGFIRPSSSGASVSFDTSGFHIIFPQAVDNNVHMEMGNEFIKIF
jgi:hypothetical protein